MAAQAVLHKTNCPILRTSFILVSSYPVDLARRMVWRRKARIPDEWRLHADEV